ncbi:MAG: DUF4865 family protein [Alphaproteobacteria bacterium]
MLAMQLCLRFGAHCDGAALHRRVGGCARRDGRSGDLLLASCLIDEDDGLYAPFYIWRSDDALCGFLLGGPFADVVGAVGRPRLRTWNVLEFDAAAPAITPRFAVREIDALDGGESLALAARREGARHRTALDRPGLHAHAVMIDPERWEVARLSLWRDERCATASDADCVNTYRVGRFSEPVAA